MDFDLKLLLILVVCLLNLLLFFNLRSLIGVVYGFVVSNLLLILFLALVVEEFLVFEEILLILLLYIGAVVFLLCEQKEIRQKNRKIKEKMPSFRVLLTVICGSVAVFLFLVAAVRLTVEGSLKGEGKPSDLAKVERVLGKGLAQSDDFVVANEILFHKSSVFLMLACFILPILLVRVSERR